MAYKEIFELLFQVEPQTGNFLIDAIVPILLSLIFYKVVFMFVGKLYDSGVVWGNDIGSLLHWLLRCGLIYISIKVFNQFIHYWPILLVSIIILIIICIMIKYNKNLV
ncbi:Uncharacterised protein [Acholeplasma hippikon]|uniref:Uncharacterized protein n=1 Tax=Acholeplasma hippikon TaxID=264636 RepID=A0A449BL06_9MOLU|nr:Uncharacterised protein [Acholeplasma hippikon]